MEQLEYRTPQQHKVLFGLLNKLNWIDQRSSLAYSFSDGRTGKTSKLYEAECDLLIVFLQQEINKSKEEAEQTKKELMLRKFFYYCHELNWKNNGRLDYGRINYWLLKYGYLKKGLKKYTATELPKLLQQIEKVLEKRKMSNNDKD